MPTPPKTAEAMTKHMTAAQREARIMAEEQLCPLRESVRLKKPPWLKGKGAKYWKSILERMQDTAILDDLDAEMLAAYCSQLQHREELVQILTEAKDAGSVNRDDVLAIEKQINAQDRSLLAYAEKLGCTPSGRVRLAQRRASAAAENDPNGDLFG